MMRFVSRSLLALCAGCTSLIRAPERCVLPCVPFARLAFLLECAVQQFHLMLGVAASSCACCIHAMFRVGSGSQPNDTDQDIMLALQSRHWVTGS